MTKLIYVGLGLALVAVLSLSSAQDRPQGGLPEKDRPSFEPGPIRVLEPDTIAVRLLLGVGDTTVQQWDGKVTLDRGEVVGVDGWRLRDKGQITGRDSWEATSLLIRNPDALKAKNAR